VRAAADWLDQVDRIGRALRFEDETLTEQVSDLFTGTEMQEDLRSAARLIDSLARENDALKSIITQVDQAVHDLGKTWRNGRVVNLGPRFGAIQQMMRPVTSVDPDNGGLLATLAGNHYDATSDEESDWDVMFGPDHYGDGEGFGKPAGGAT